METPRLRPPGLAGLAEAMKEAIAQFGHIEREAQLLPEGFEMHAIKLDLPARPPASSAGPNRAAAGRDDEDRGR